MSVSVIFSGYSGFSTNTTDRYSWNIVESGIKHHYYNPSRHLVNYIVWASCWPICFWFYLLLVLFCCSSVDLLHGICSRYVYTWISVCLTLVNRLSKNNSNINELTVANLYSSPVIGYNLDCEHDFQISSCTHLSGCIHIVRLKY